MKKLLTILIFVLFSSTIIYPQIQLKDSSDGWYPGSEVALNISQIAFTDWSQGGENSVTWALITTNALGFKRGTWIKNSNLKISYGRTKISGAESRVNDNEFFLETVVSKYIGWVIDPYFSNNIRTPIAPGYNYKVSPSVQVVGFFDPGYVTQSAGFQYGGLSGFKFRIGAAVQEIFTNKFRSFSDDTLTHDKMEAFKAETGIESVAEADYNITPTLNVKSNLRLFGRFEQMDVWDVRWDNSITAKVTEFINVNLNVILLHDIKQTRRSQVKEALQIGIFYRLL